MRASYDYPTSSPHREEAKRTSPSLPYQPLAMKPLTSISFLLSLAIVMATAATAAATEDETANYLIEVEAPPTGVSCASYQLGILTAALGSEEKAKEALLYNYKNVLSGFSARLTPSQLKALEKQPAVTRVLPSANLKLMSTTYEGVS